MDPDGLTRFPPILQIAGVSVLAAYVLLSLLGRVSPMFRWLWADPREARTATHWIEYTILPALLLVGSTLAVVANWDPMAPWLGGWSVRQLLLGPALAGVGVVL